MTLESKAKKLQEWNQEIRKMRQLPPPQPQQQEAIKNAVKKLPNKRVDLVLFDDQPPDVEWGFAGLIEFKCWNPGKDRDKVRRLLDFLDMCPAGAVLCLMNMHCDHEDMQVRRREAEDAGDRFFCHNVPELPPWRAEGHRHYSVHARAFLRQ